MKLIPLVSFIVGNVQLPVGHVGSMAEWLPSGSKRDSNMAALADELFSPVLSFMLPVLQSISPGTVGKFPIV